MSLLSRCPTRLWCFFGRSLLSRYSWSSFTFSLPHRKSHLCPPHRFQYQPTVHHPVAVLNDTVIQRIEKQIGYSFQHKHWLRLAFVHASVHYDMETWDKITESTKTDLQNNERLEFLGDSIFNFVVAEFLFTWFPHLDEGGLSEMRSCLVSRKACEQYFEKLQLVEYLVVKKGLEKLKNTTSVLAGALEAVVGAIYLDGGFEAVRHFVYIQLGNTMLDMLNDPPRNYKSLLQEYVNSQNKQVEYVEKSCKGPSHQREFIYHAVVDQVIVGQGKGESKKEAQQKAAKEALARLGVLSKEDECIQSALYRARKRVDQLMKEESDHIIVEQGHLDNNNNKKYNRETDLVERMKGWNVQSWNTFQRLMDRKYHNLRTIQASMGIKNVLSQLASTFDQNGTFARESYVRCQLEAIPAANIPSKYGGEDISISDCLEVLIELSSGCISTAYGFAHHFATIGFLRDWLLSYSSSTVEDMFWEVALRQSFCYTILPPHISKGNPLMASSFANQKTKSWIIQGVAEQVVASPLMDFFVTFIPLIESSHHDKSPLGMVLVPKSSAMKIQKWVNHQNGLKASGMSFVVFDQVKDSHLITSHKGEISLAMLLSHSWHFACLSAIYIGLAKAAMEQVTQLQKDSRNVLCLQMEYLQLKSGLKCLVEGWNEISFIEQRHTICNMLERHYLLIVPQVRRFIRSCYDYYPYNPVLERLNRDCNVALLVERYPMTILQ
ncbi:ribonuclease III [Galdieria sulphuraria]|uniref:ribonuclease III n=1 Tax=Galdieria sulphuraria TaxID=130081 RepID=M2X994_GALSU|nr:ribonuclease III [Galdieria sulphuraria]EME26377.1 ribonuclease III [Galdieria sulphuraria]|eukprot:XP_005702897.1 ribonuclease III [Galdieria sulphuraria]